jgi:hypothetical protein
MVKKGGPLLEPFNVVGYEKVRCMHPLALFVDESS